MKNYSEISQISEFFDIPTGVLVKIWEQKMIEKSKRDFSKIQRNINRFLSEWLSGRSFIEISNRYTVSPVLTSNAILKKLKFTKKQIKRFNKNPDLCSDKRISKELKEVAKADYMFSHEANKRSDDMGKIGEYLIKKLLCDRNIEFMEENELRQKSYEKTPDFLFEMPLNIDGVDVHWVDSKMLFGNLKNHRKYEKNQFLKYTNLFGPGLVIYWFGYINTIDDLDSVKNKLYIVKDYKMFEEVYPDEIGEILNYLPK